MLEKILNFLKEFPDKWLLFVVFVLCWLSYFYIRDDFTKQVANMVVGALLGLLIGRSRGETNITTDTVQMPDNNRNTIKTFPIDNEETNKATINISKDSNEKLKK